MAWRVARSLLTLREQIDAAFPNRNTASDGTIGDADHRNRTSDHNPWYGPGIVTALDITHDPAHGVDIDRLTDELQASRDPRIKYVIANGLIMDTRPGYSPWQWVPYSGINPHTRHMHVSVVASPLCDDDSPWNLPSLGGRSGGGAAAPARPEPETWKDDEPMPIPLPTGVHAISFQIPAGTDKLAINCPHGELTVRTLFTVGDGYPSKVEADGVPAFDLKRELVPDNDKGKTIHRLRPWRVDVPKGATSGAIYYHYPVPDKRYTYTGSLDFIR